jgi:ribosome-associated translation inhibitor RaiA
MNVDLQTRGFTLTRALEAAVRRELQALNALDRGNRLQVRLFDVNGARGGVDKGCLVTLHLSGKRRVIAATEVDADLYRAIPGAFDKLRRSLQAAAQRARTRRRRDREPVHTDSSN